MSPVLQSAPADEHSSGLSQRAGGGLDWMGLVMVLPVVEEWG